MPVCLCVLMLCKMCETHACFLHVLYDMSKHYAQLMIASNDYIGAVGIKVVL